MNSRLSPTSWSLSRVLAWLCLLATASTIAYGVELAAARVLPPAAVDVGERHSPLPEAGATTSTHEVLITGLDGTTSDRMQVVCVAASDQIAINALVVELKNLRDVAAQLCNIPSAPVVSPGSPY
jgi:hypothetical protein